MHAQTGRVGAATGVESTKSGGDATSGLQKGANAFSLIASVELGVGSGTGISVRALLAPSLGCAARLSPRIVGFCAYSPACTGKLCLSGSNLSSASATPQVPPLLAFQLPRSPWSPPSRSSAESQALPALPVLAYSPTAALGSPTGPNRTAMAVWAPRTSSWSLRTSLQPSLLSSPLSTLWCLWWA